MPIIVSPSMNLPVPIVGVELGKAYAYDVNNCMGLIDSHDHSFGKGVPITPNGLNINTDLQINNNNLVSVQTVRFFPQASLIPAVSPNIGCLYESGVDLYYNDGSGNQVRITQSGGVAGSPGSISGLVSPASASYSPGSSTFTWQSAANTPANMDAASYIFRNLVANSHSLTLNPPSGMGSDYSLTLPTLPIQTNVMTLDTSGNMGSITYDQVGQGMTSTGANAIAASITKTVGSTVGVGGVAVSATSGAFSTTSSVPVLVSGVSCTLTSTGNPVKVMLTDDGTENTSTYLFGAGGVVVTLYIDSAPVGTQFYGAGNSPAYAGLINLPSSVISFMTYPTAGTHLYEIALQTGTEAELFFSKLVVYELR